MLWSEYEGVLRQARKRFSEGDKRNVAERQNYCCTCDVCAGQVLLNTEWHFDHIHPLWRGGSNELSNMQVLNAGCHARKTREEQMEFHRQRRADPLGELRKLLPASYYSGVATCDASTQTEAVDLEAAQSRARVCALELMPMRSDTDTDGVVALGVLGGQLPCSKERVSRVSFLSRV